MFVVMETDIGMVEYDVVVLTARRRPGGTYSETGLQEMLDAHAADEWVLRFIIPEAGGRLLVTFERPLP